MNESCITMYKCRYTHYSEIGGGLNMANISSVTRRDIFDLFEYGIDASWDIFEDTIYYPYYGRFDIFEFLKRLYDLKTLESKDFRFDNAEDEILMHTRNGDYSECWIFDDERFQLRDGDDSILLKFLCEVFHPEVRDDKKNWKFFLDKINELLHEDGYELFVSDKLSGREVFDWRLYDKKNDVFIPFSIRNKDCKINIILTDDTRYQLCKVIEEFHEKLCLTNETGYQFYKSIEEFVVEDIEKYYIPEHLVNNNSVEIKDFMDFKQGTSLLQVFDVIECFSNHSTNYDLFEARINNIFMLNHVGFELKNKRINSSEIAILDDIVKIDEMGINELIEVANSLYREHNYSLAVEKIWDAFERMKTYYGKDKKVSANKIIDKLSNGDSVYKELFEEEFLELTRIGNAHCIRHHEKGKIPIENELQYKYFYLRCYALISVVMDLLK